MMTKTRNPLSRVNTRSTRLVSVWLVAAPFALAFYGLSQVMPATAFIDLPLATICQGIAAVIFATLFYRAIVPCPVCKYGQNAASADAWTCPHCKIGFKAADPAPEIKAKRDDAGPWE